MARDLLGNNDSRRATTAPDILSIVEAAYVVDGSAQEWAAGLLTAADASVGAGLGGFACMFQGTTKGTIAIDRSTAAALRQEPKVVSAIFDGLTHAPPGWLSGYLFDQRSAARCLMTSEVDPNFKLEYRARLARDGIEDGINVACLDLDLNGFLLSLGVPGSKRLTPKTKHELGRVATHILAGLRLRKRLGATGPAATEQVPPSEPAPAVLAPDGTLLHAEGDATLVESRRALHAAVCNVERARGAVRGDSGEALRLWKGLVSARWTLVDQFDSHGTKYVVARENPPRATGVAVLTPTERCVVAYAARGFSTKEIAYTLGISDTTVRVLMMRAARRCGVSSRDDLLRLGASAPAFDEDLKDVP